MKITLRQWVQTSRTATEAARFKFETAKLEEVVLKTPDGIGYGYCFLRNEPEHWDDCFQWWLS